MEVVDPVQDLIQEGLDHSFWNHDWFLRGLRRPVVLDDVPEVMLCKIKEEPDFPIRVGEEDSLEADNVRVLQLTE